MTRGGGEAGTSGNLWEAIICTTRSMGGGEHLFESREALPGTPWAERWAGISVRDRQPCLLTPGTKTLPSRYSTQLPVHFRHGTKAICKLTNK